MGDTSTTTARASDQSTGQSTRRRPLLIAVGVGAVLLLGACSSIDPETLEQVETSRDQQEALGGPDNALEDATDAQVSCIDRTTSDDELDMEAVVADASSIGTEARIAFANIVIGCVDDLATLPSYRDQFTTTLNAAFGVEDGTDGSIDAVEGGCLLQYTIDNADDPGEALISSASENSLEVLQAGFDECFDESTKAMVSGEAGAGPQVYGDAPGLDALYDDCSAGNEQACDLLFVKSSAGSEYQALAFDCAGRGDGETFCTPGLDIDETGTVVAGAPVLATLQTACETGDMTSCDVLFSFGIPGSEDEQFGYTCGGRIAVGAIPDCRTRFPADED